MEKQMDEREKFGAPYAMLAGARKCFDYGGLKLLT
jgi:hypothetical protein